jgi:glycosyltransferase involved in cell wall biosynthesis
VIEVRIGYPHMGFSAESNSGGDVADRELLLALAQLGAEMYVPLFGRRPNALSAPNIIFRQSRYNRTFGTGTAFPNIAYASMLAATHKRHGLDVVRFYSQDHGYCAAFVRKYLGIPVVWNYYHLEKNFNERWQSRWFLRVFDAVTASSHATRKDLVESYGAVEDRIHVIPCGISPFFRPRPVDRRKYRSYGIEGRRILLHVGALIPRKNLAFLLDVFSEVRREIPESLLVLCGDSYSPYDPYKKLLLEKAEALGVASSVVVLGKVDEEEKLDWYNLSDVFVFPSLKEGFGFAPGEAMACEKPVVCSNTWSLPELVREGECGWTASPHDRVGFARRIVQLLSDPEMRAHFGGRGRSIILEEYQWSNVAKQTLSLYEEVISRDAVERKGQGAGPVGRVALDRPTPDAGQQVTTP